jgi:myo-inositol-1(or 4)-monophosphatase
MASRIMRASPPGLLTAKGDRDVVSEVDLAIERQLRAHLHEKTPGIGFLGEEDGSAAWGDGRLLWALDPVDGTVNYVRSVPLCAVSLALLDQGRPVLGVIDLPFLSAHYHAVHRGGAYAQCGACREGAVAMLASATTT